MNPRPSAPKGSLSLDDAFDMHHQVQRELEKGLDPIEERAKRQEAEQRAREAPV
ncbi:MAG: hypothetical protein ACRET5_18895 [Steroidobacteraceae bacterium]